MKPISRGDGLGVEAGEALRRLAGRGPYCQSSFSSECVLAGDEDVMSLLFHITSSLFGPRSRQQWIGVDSFGTRLKTHAILA